MKRIINSVFAFLGLKAPFSKTNFDRAKKHYSQLITVEQQAIDFVQDALKVINDALRSELKRNGYEPQDVLSKLVTVNATATTSKTDHRFKSQIYSVGGFVILRVNWKPNGFTLEANTMTQVKAHKEFLRANDGVNSGEDGLKGIKEKEVRDVELDALTNKKLIEQKNAEVVK